MWQFYLNVGDVDTELSDEELKNRMLCKILAMSYVGKYKGITSILINFSCLYLLSETISFRNSGVQILH